MLILSLFLIIETICPNVWAKLPLKDEKSHFLLTWSLKKVFAYAPYEQVNTNVITSVIPLIRDPLSYTDCTISLFRL